MLNGKKILSVCGAVALLLGVGMNLRHSLNDYGMGTNSLSTFGGDVITFKGVLWDCKDGWNPFCTKDCRAAK